MATETKYFIAKKDTGHLKKGLVYEGEYSSRSVAVIKGVAVGVGCTVEPFKGVAYKCKSNAYVTLEEGSIYPEGYKTEPGTNPVQEIATYYPSQWERIDCRDKEEEKPQKEYFIFKMDHSGFKKGLVHEGITFEEGKWAKIDGMTYELGESVVLKPFKGVAYKALSHNYTRTDKGDILPEDHVFKQTGAVLKDVLEYFPLDWERIDCREELAKDTLKDSVRGREEKATSFGERYGKVGRLCDAFKEWDEKRGITSEDKKLVDSPSQYNYINPPHYTQFSKEVIDMMVAIWGPEAVATYCEINAFKYRLRLGSKPDQPVERDLGKALWYEKKRRDLLDPPSTDKQQNNKD